MIANSETVFKCLLDKFLKFHQKFSNTLHTIFWEVPSPAVLAEHSPPNWKKSEKKPGVFSLQRDFPVLE
jgi:hypothetical protein